MQSFVLYGQAIKRIRWMPWQLEAMKDVLICDKLWWVDKTRYNHRFPNGETHPLMAGIMHWIHRCMKRTWGTETSKYPEENKSIEIPLVAASERGLALKLLTF